MKNIDHALKYIQDGHYIFPIYEAVDGICSCGNMECKSQGKHPRNQSGVLQASNNPEQIKQWWGRWPNASIGLRTGAEFGLIVLDVDDREGKCGPASLLRLGFRVEEFGWVNKTGSGGYHIFFKSNDETLTNRQAMMEGLDLRGSNGYVILPPSSHVSGEFYEEIRNNGGDEIPKALLELFKKPKGGNVARVGTAMAAKFTEGSRDNALLSMAGTMRRAGFSVEEIHAALMVANKNRCTTPKDEADIDRLARNAAKYEPTAPITVEASDLYAFINRSNYIVNLEDANDYMLVDLNKGDVRKIDVLNIMKELGKEESKNFFANREIRAGFDYNPRVMAPIFTDELGINAYNQYIPPTWLRGAFFRGEEVVAIAELPEIYDTFFSHLTNGDDASQEYLVDWLARSLHSMNYTFLTAIGDQGIGKGILGTIMQKLHGQKNFVKVRDSVFKERFNSTLQNRTLVYVDEADLKTRESQDRLKDMSNPEIEYEAKGKDAKSGKNFASTYISSNNMDAVKIEAGDRRFSVIELTSTKLIDTDLVSIIRDLTLDSNIDQLARYLLFKEITSKEVKENRVFRGVRYEAVRESGLDDWESWVINDWAPKHSGKEIIVSELQMDIETAKVSPWNKPPGRRKISALCRKYPEVLTMQQTPGTGVYHLKILKR